MSSKWERDMQNWLFFGGEFPGLTEALPNVPVPARPIPVKYVRSTHPIPVRIGDTIRFTLHDFEVAPNEYMDGNGDYISRAEAIEEVKWLNRER